MSRYNRFRILTNAGEYYRFLRQERNNIKAIQQYETPILYNPDLIDRITIKSTTHVWSIGDRFYRLAHEYYGNSTYWWVIAWYNGLPTEADVLPGDLITIPTDLEQMLKILGVG